MNGLNTSAKKTNLQYSKLDNSIIISLSVVVVRIELSWEHSYIAHTQAKEIQGVPCTVNVKNYEDLLQPNVLRRLRKNKNISCAPPYKIEIGPGEKGLCIGVFETFSQSIEHSNTIAMLLSTESFITK